MTTDIVLRCVCGALRGYLRDVGPGAGCHLVCYCRDCRAFACHLGQHDSLEPGGGTALYQTLPARIDIEQGREHIACLRLSPRGLFRWYAACCNTPLANTVGTPKMPFAGLWRGLLQDIAPLGPVQARGFTKFAQPGPGAPKKDSGMGVMAWGTLRRSLGAYIAGRVHPNPFFECDGRPRVGPMVLSEAERKAAFCRV